MSKKIKYVALLRGINVGGKNKIKMERLREVFSDALDFENVKTYINSGNVLFETAQRDDKKLAGEIEKAIEKEFSLNIRVVVRTLDEIERIIKNNPFEGQFETDKNLHVLFLDEEMPEEKRALLLSNNKEEEKFAVSHREIFYLLHADFSDSLLGKDYIGKKLKINATARNWRTVNKLFELLQN